MQLHVSLNIQRHTNIKRCRRTYRYISIVRYWLKIVTSEERKYSDMSKTLGGWNHYNMADQSRNDIEEQPLKQNWALSVKAVIE